MKVYEKLKFTDKLIARNRVIMPPMDTLMAEDGIANEFHIQHYGARAFGGVGTIIVESTAVAPEGRIRDRDLGLWKDEQIAPMASVTSIVKKASALIGVQLNHAGAKSESTMDTTFGSTKFYSYLDANRKFRLMNETDLKNVVDAFVKTAARAKVAGFDFVEIHGAHGYLINELLHPTLNEVFPAKTIMERAAFLIEIIDRINTEVKIPVGIRLSASDHDPKGVDETYYFPLIEALNSKVIYFNISSGEAVSHANIAELTKAAGTKMFRIPLARKVKAMTDKVVFTGGNVSSMEDAEEVINAGIDGAFIGRELIFNPYLVLHGVQNLEDINEEDYHWNQNIWFSPKRYLSLMKQLKLK